VERRYLGINVDTGEPVSLTRRRFMHTLGAGTASSLLGPYLSVHGLEIGDVDGRSADAIRLDRNENPNGPAKEALSGIVAALGESSRYPDEVMTYRLDYVSYLR
jgi:hypothetical protein